MISKLWAGDIGRGDSNPGEIRRGPSSRPGDINILCPSDTPESEDESERMVSEPRPN